MLPQYGYVRYVTLVWIRALCYPNMDMCVMLPQYGYMRNQLCLLHFV